MDFTSARTWLNRIEDTFDDAVPAEAVAKRLRAQAETLFKTSSSLSDAEASRALEQALALWPRLPEARDALNRRRGTYATLTIAVPALPEMLSPATASTLTERQALDLLYDRLYHAELHTLGYRYRPQIAAALPTNGSIPLHRDVYWSDGHRLTAADVRHTALLMNQPDAIGRSALWRDYLETRARRRPICPEHRVSPGITRSAEPADISRVATILPWQTAGHATTRISPAPLGSGPFLFAGRKVESGRIYAVF